MCDKMYASFDGCSGLHHTAIPSVAAAIQQPGSLLKISVFMGFGQTAMMAHGHRTATKTALLMNLR